MTVKNRRATIYMEEQLHKLLRLKAIETSSSISQLVNDAVQASFAEDADNLQAFEERKHEPLVSYQEMLMRLRRPSADNLDARSS